MPPALARHLWQVEHSYYCAPGDHFKAGCETRYASWADFQADYATSDPDYDLLFRWDWHLTGCGPDGTLELFFVGQRKAVRWSATVHVHVHDEPAVRAFLAPRLAYLLGLWAPLTAPATRR